VVVSPSREHVVRDARALAWPDRNALRRKAGSWLPFPAHSKNWRRGVWREVRDLSPLIVPRILSFSKLRLPPSVKGVEHLFGGYALQATVVWTLAVEAVEFRADAFLAIQVGSPIYPVRTDTGGVVSPQ